MSRFTKNAFKPLFNSRALSVAIATFLLGNIAHAFDSGSTGADGVFSPTVNTVVQLPPSGVLNYTSVSIPQGVTVTFKKNALNTPVYILVSGDATINGTLSVSATKAADTGTAGDGNLADDGNPGLGGPGGYDGGRGGKPDPQLRPRITSGVGGLGPGGGYPGTGRPKSVDGCVVNNFISSFIYHNTAGRSASYSELGESASAAIACPGQEADGYLSNPLMPETPIYGSSVLQPLVGGSGGGGGSGGANYSGSGGGGGGGALLLAVSGILDLSDYGKIIANGTLGGNVSGANAGGKGGKGSGGAIRIMATSFKGSGSLQACTFTYDDGNCIKKYHDNLPGRIRIETDSTTYIGVAQPQFVADTPAPVFLSNVPSLKFVSIGGTNVPANPTGKGDVSFPSTLANPVTVQLATTNVPPGNTVTVKLVPAIGLPIEIVSPAITGTTASGTASVQLTLPQGASTLQAMTTYTLVVAMGEALSQFANNERVEKVQIVANMGQPSQDKAKLITISGKEFEIPVAVLQMVAATYQNPKAL